MATELMLDLAEFVFRMNRDAAANFRSLEREQTAQDMRLAALRSSFGGGGGHGFQAGSTALSKRGNRQARRAIRREERMAKNASEAALTAQQQAEGRLRQNVTQGTQAVGSRLKKLGLEFGRQKSGRQRHTGGGGSFKQAFSMPFNLKGKIKGL